jgi:hypothetical protein
MAAYFYRRVAEHSSHRHPELFVDWIRAHDARTNLSENLSHRLIRQLLGVYEADGFRCNVDRRLWGVTFAGELGIDTGGFVQGLAFELV